MKLWNRAGGDEQIVRMDWGGTLSSQKQSNMTWLPGYHNHKHCDYSGPVHGNQESLQDHSHLGEKGSLSKSPPVTSR